MTSLAEAANSRRKSWWAALILIIALLCTLAFAQESPQGQPASFLRANDIFAVNLLKVVHEQEQDRNIVLAPLPVSLTFAALWDGTEDTDSAKEIQTAFQWEKAFGTNIAARMLLARFAKPKPYSVSRAAPTKRPDSILEKYLRSGKPEELWLSGAFLYRGEGSLSQEFIDRVKYDFGFTFRAVGEHASQSQTLAKNWDSSLPMPNTTGSNDFWITTATHLRTSWAGNTFVNAKREKHEFNLRSGNKVQADFLKSEMFVYPHVRTQEFEAVVLSCSEASLLLVLPTSGEDMGQLEVALAGDPTMIETLLRPEQGDVRLPPFHFSFENDLRASLKKMGVLRIFSDPRTLISMAPYRDGGVLRGVAQKTEITLDENGIRADAGIIVRGVYGGILAVQTPFHMLLDRPFLFLVRDPVTGALLFAGVVMNPTLQ